MDEEQEVDVFLSALEHSIEAEVDAILDRIGREHILRHLGIDLGVTDGWNEATSGGSE